jgi:hypothetical protein
MYLKDDLGAGYDNGHSRTLKDPSVRYRYPQRQRTSVARSLDGMPSPTSAARSVGYGKAQRTTDLSLRTRLAAALDRNRQLADVNARLRRPLARALGD